MGNMAETQTVSLSHLKVGAVSAAQELYKAGDHILFNDLLNGRVSLCRNHLSDKELCFFKTPANGYLTLSPDHDNYCSLCFSAGPHRSLCSTRHLELKF